MINSKYTCWFQRTQARVASPNLEVSEEPTGVCSFADRLFSVV